MRESPPFFSTEKEKYDMIKNKCNVTGTEKKSGEDLMENMIEIADSQRGLLWILFAVLVLAVFFGICIEEKERKY